MKEETENRRKRKMIACVENIQAQIKKLSEMDYYIEDVAGSIVVSDNKMKTDNTRVVKTIQSA